MLKSLDIKLARIAADPSCRDFILADAKDADMAGGMAAPGVHPDGRLKTLAEYRDHMRENVRQGLLDIMLMSASTSELLTIKERLFDGTAITPACRANDTTDIHLSAGAVYSQQPSRPFRTAAIEQIMYGKVNPRAGDPVVGADLGLYSVTFNNNLERDLESLQAYRAFRIEAETKGFRHFMEVFNPNMCGDVCPQDVGRYLNDQIARTLAGVVGKGRPVFLKIPYHGPAAMEQLASYDRSLIVGILGGASGTSYDAFFQLWEARKHGARAALYGRMINNSEHQPSMVQHLRWLADGDLDDPAEAVRSYHAALRKAGVAPFRALEDDLKSTLRQAAYSGVGGKPAAPAASAPSSSTRQPQFSDKVQQNLAHWSRVLS